MIREATDRAPFEPRPTPPRPLALDLPTLREQLKHVRKFHAYRAPHQPPADPSAKVELIEFSAEFDWPDMLRDNAATIYMPPPPPGESVASYQEFAREICRQIAERLGIPAYLANPRDDA